MPTPRVNLLREKNNGENNDVKASKPMDIKNINTCHENSVINVKELLK